MLEPYLSTHIYLQRSFNPCSYDLYTSQETLWFFQSYSIPIFVINFCFNSNRSKKSFEPTK